jgi:hypothetical protein
MRNQAPLPGDHRPTITPDPTADILARVYALILSWPLGDAARRDDELRDNEEAAND